MFQNNLKALRKEKGITQEELAARLNVVRQTVSKWEKGLSVPDSDLLIKLAEILDVPVSRLLGSKIEAETKPDALAEQLSRINEQLAVQQSGICIRNRFDLGRQLRYYGSSYDRRNGSSLCDRPCYLTF